MNPGRDLDALIAEKVMGCKLVDKNQALANAKDQIEYEYLRLNKPEYWCDCPGKIHMDTDDYGIPFWIKEYSTDIGAAWEVVEKFDRIDLLRIYTGEWSCMFNGPPDCVINESAPLAICLAALKANGVDTNKHFGLAKVVSKDELKKQY